VWRNTRTPLSGEFPLEVGFFYYFFIDIYHGATFAIDLLTRPSAKYGRSRVLLFRFASEFHG